MPACAQSVLVRPVLWFAEQRRRPQAAAEAVARSRLLCDADARRGARRAALDAQARQSVGPAHVARRHRHRREARQRRLQARVEGSFVARGVASSLARSTTFVAQFVDLPPKSLLSPLDARSPMMKAAAAVSAPAAQ